MQIADVVWTCSAVRGNQARIEGKEVFEYPTNATEELVVQGTKS